MTVDQIFRTARRAGLAAAVIGIPSDAFHFTMADGRAAASGSFGFRLHGLGMLTAFTLALLALGALALAQQGRGGRRGAVGAGLALFGMTFVIADLGKEAFGLPLAPAALGEPQGYYLLVVIASFAALTVGWVLTALSLRRTGALSGPANGLLVVGALLALPPIPGAYIVLLLGIAVAASQLRAPAAEPAPQLATAA